mgnify:CR=1 FL=1
MAADTATMPSRDWTRATFADGSQLLALIMPADWGTYPHDDQVDAKRRGLSARTVLPDGAERRPDCV